ncbi:cytochrome P450 736A117-like [Hibiscus syriacus]|uniref:cytochrome P450 736A117-like n=1 Tax=Hibiscus syriacus TaxID=106335 RepID=UPI0019210585|nr:cytochrome P450 736A117-like [Hibiscus syriacus]
MEDITRSCSSGLPVNLSELFSATTNNVVSRIALGRKYSEDTNKFKKLLSDFSELLGTSNVGDYLAWLAWVSHVNGFNDKADKGAKAFDEFLDGVIEERINRRNKHVNYQNDLVDILLEVQKENTVGLPIDRTSIKALILYEVIITFSFITDVT